MDSLFLRQQHMLHNVNLGIVRDIMHKIKWDNHLISLRGARGVGKTTLMLQYIKMNYPIDSTEVLYCSMENIYFTTHTLVELAENFTLLGGKRLMIDEVHLYPGWSREIKEIHDLFPQLKICISGSSLLNILNADADLSRRCIPYDIHGLSFAEYLKFYHGITTPTYTLDQLLNNAGEICEEITKLIRPIGLFKRYLTEGFYPFFKNDREDYYIMLENIMTLVIETEIPRLFNMDVAYSRKLRALMLTIAGSVPFEVDISKLSRSLELNRATVLSYLHYLSKSGLVNLLYSDNTSLKKMQKPDKIFINNPNILSMLGQYTEVKVGTVRETFAVNQLKVNHTVEYAKDNGDLKVDGKYTFEIGGKDKSFTQIANVPDSYVFADDIELPIGKKLPLWTLGLLY